MARRGAAVVVNDSGTSVEGTGASEGPADLVVAEITAGGGRATASYASVAEAEGAATIINTAVERFGGLDIVINNAGISKPAKFEDLDLDILRLLLSVHLYGTVFVTKAAWPYLKRSGQGRIVNTVSGTIYGVTGYTAYGAAKGAILALTRSLAVEGAPDGIKANCIRPSAGTRMGSVSLNPSSPLVAQVAERSPRLVAAVAAYLAHESCQLSGETLTALGGHVGRLYLSETVGFTSDDLSPEDVAEHLEEIVSTTGSMPMGLIE
jgi:NAD(P)-dependent dehydrogenase (short-subunit alcohol dehydrogenase family)